MAAVDGETKAILEAIRDRLLVDTRLRDWSQTNLGAKPNVYLGINPRFLPPKAAYPLVAVFDVSRVDRGSTRNRHQYEIQIGAGVHDASSTVAGTPGDGQAFTLNGFILVEGLRDMAEDALYRLGLKNNWKVDSSGQTASDDDNFFFKSFSSITIEVIAGSMQSIGK